MLMVVMDGGIAIAMSQYLPICVMMIKITDTNQHHNGTIYLTVTHI